MAKPAADERLELNLVELLAPFPGRLEYAARLALICALTTLVVEIYQTPDPALTAYLAFFVIKPDRTTSIVVSLVMVLLMSLVIGATFLLAKAVIDDAMWRVVAMTVLSLCLLFAASSSKLKPVGAIIALIVGYAIDLPT
jgi:multidrug resistance protein MdtO